ncbi:MAG: 30S ribosomal protein S8 [Candidatus Azambacteria bacterium]|nr:30S ribosomal protein S8 [Candidatus Azambacteria bacterium]
MDPIADMLTRIRNAKSIGHETVSIPYSQIKSAILVVLKREKFIENFEKKGKKINKSIVVKLKYQKDGSPAISNITRVSKQGQRVYRPATKIHSVQDGFGVAVISTPKGLMTDREARRKNIGGEIICEVW